MFWIIVFFAIIKTELGKVVRGSSLQKVMQYGTFALFRVTRADLDYI